MFASGPLQLRFAPPGSNLQLRHWFSKTYFESVQLHLFAQKVASGNHSRTVNFAELVDDQSSIMMQSSLSEFQYQEHVFHTSCFISNVSLQKISITRLFIVTTSPSQLNGKFTPWLSSNGWSSWCKIPTGQKSERVDLKGDPATSNGPRCWHMQAYGIFW